MWISQGILGQILENVRAEFISTRPPMPIFPALNDSSMKHIRPPPLAASCNYNSTPLHTMTLTPAVFRPTQIPLDITRTQAIPSQVAEPTIMMTAVLEPSSIDPVNTVTQPPPNPTGVQNLEVEDRPLAAITTTPNIPNQTEGQSQSLMISNSAQPSVEDMDTAMSAITNSIENNT